MDRLIKSLSKLALDWGSLTAVITGGLTIAFFIFNIITVNTTQAEQLKEVTQDVEVLKSALPAIERSLGRIEGKLGIYPK